MKWADVIITLKYSRNLSNNIHRWWAYSNCWWSNIDTILVIQNLFTWLQRSNTTEPNTSIGHRTDQQDPIVCHQIVAHPHTPLKKIYTAITTQWAAPCWLNSTLYTTINATRSLDSSALMPDSMTQKKMLKSSAAQNVTSAWICAWSRSWIDCRPLYHVAVGIITLQLGNYKFVRKSCQILIFNTVKSTSTRILCIAAPKAWE